MYLHEAKIVEHVILLGLICVLKSLGQADLQDKNIEEEKVVFR